MAKERFVLFTYGTLMSGQRNARCLGPTAVLIGPGAIRGKLFCVSSYPGAVPGDGIVVGELWEVEAEQLTTLDRLEGCLPNNEDKSNYVRREEQVTQPGGAVTTAWVYWYNRPTDQLRPIPSGDWRGYWEARR